MKLIKQIGWIFALGERRNGTVEYGGATLRDDTSQQAGRCYLRLKNQFSLIYSTVG
jgi:hypothetical protein